MRSPEREEFVVDELGHRIPLPRASTSGSVAVRRTGELRDRTKRTPASSGLWSVLGIDPFVYSSLTDPWRR